MRPILFLRNLLKAHNKGYVTQKGTFVAPFDDKRASAKPAAPKAPKPMTDAEEEAHYEAQAQAHFAKPKPQAKWSASGSTGGSGQKIVGAQYGGKTMGGGSSSQSSLWNSDKPAHKPLPPDAVAHPRKGEKGQTVMIHYPSKPTEPSTWKDPNAIASWTPGSALPDSLNGVPFESWADAPRDEEGWDYVEGQNDDIEEPGMELPKGKIPASGVIVMEDDGRCWVVAPTNRFGNTVNTFPKGGRDYGLSLQANAIKEAYEESGLKVEIQSYLGDVERSTSVARYYLARRVGGTPGDMGWESQAVRLVPAAQLKEFLDRTEDKKVAEWLESLHG